jgi:hypothetical protein
VFFVPAAGVCGAIAACSQASPTAKNPGDDIYVDTEASTTSYAQPDGYVAPDSPFAPVYEDATYGSTYGGEGGYTALTVCEPPDGSTPSDAGAAGADASPAYGTGSAGACLPFPAECADATPCTCLITHFAAQTPCTYPHCETGNGFSIDCPQ